MKPTNNYFSILSIALTLFFFSCGPESKKSEDQQSVEKEEVDLTTENNKTTISSSSEAIYESGNLRVYPAFIAKRFPNAKLMLDAPKVSEVNKAAEYDFKFSVEDYELAKQTEKADMRHCANSKKGQHIHYILNNSPYVAHYEPNFKAELMDGNNVVLAFLSRSYHESIKNGTAYILKNFKVGGSASDFDETAEHLFYSRPKGTYEGEDTKKILLDFYLVNSALSSDGNKVKVNIDDNEFMLDNWAPYFVEGLSKGKHNFRIRLVDNEGNLVPGPFNDSGNREIELK